MALEVASYVSQLDENWPLGTDKQDRGDDHIRLIKSVLLNTLAGPNGTGWEKPVTVSPDQLNAFNQRITDLENGLKNVYKVNDLMIRADNVNPATLYPGTTWTLITGDYAIFLGNGANGGQTAGSNTVAVPLPAHGHGITVDGVGNHSHGGNVGTGGASFEHHQFNSRMPCEAWQSGTGQAGAHSHSATVHSAGVAGATIDVRGARIFINVWKRVT